MEYNVFLFVAVLFNIFHFIMQEQPTKQDNDAEEQYLRQFTDALRGAILANISDVGKDSSLSSLDMYRLFKKSELSVQ